MTDTTTRHEVEVVEIGAKPSVYFYARCSCGWHGTTWASRDLAQASANGHFAFQF